MSAITVNTFPSMNAFTSARGWFMAIIVLLHAGFVWMLSAGLTIRGIIEPIGPSLVQFLPREKPTVDPPEPVVDKPTIGGVIDVPVAPPKPDYDVQAESDGPQAQPMPPPTQTAGRGEVVRVPVEVAPEIDPRRGLSEPLYPSADIRAGNTGTVVLSVYVLENGRVGEVRLRQSSGHTRLDQSAMREARLWRLKPGMRDGVPVAMWKDIPITFRLTDSVKL